MPNRIREWRRKKGYSQLQLSERSGVDRSLISLYENDLGNPSVDNLTKLSNALGVGLADLFTASHIPTAAQPQAETRVSFSMPGHFNSDEEKQNFQKLVEGIAKAYEENNPTEAIQRVIDAFNNKGK